MECKYEFMGEMYKGDWQELYLKNIITKKQGKNIINFG